MAKRGVKRKGKARKVSKKLKKAVRKPKKHAKVSKKISKKAVRKPAAVAEPLTVVPVLEQRVLKKLPPAKPLDVGRQVFRVFGHPVDSKKIKNAAVEAYSKRTYTIDDIPVEHYIKENEWDNLMTKIGILDRIEEQLNLMYPHVDVVRKNRITLEIYLKE
ncbi:MAG: hypothetical protein FJY77_04685 [Candidatus Altiarchaeales archaeon]|nr:hypothetical protein [Candidatus Altiarchaeales archaeon]